jgi:hypothetical protein
LGRLYTVTFENQTYTAAGGDFDAFELVPATGKAIELVGLEIVTTSEVAEAQEEWVRLKVIRFLGGTFTSGNGTSTTPRPLDELDTAASFTAETMGSTVATSTGTQNDMWATGFNERAGYGPVILPPEVRIPVLGISGNALLVRLMGTLADDATISGTAWVSET